MASTLFSPVEGEAKDSIYTHSRIEGLLGGDLVGSALSKEASRTGIEALSVFSHNDQITCFGL